MTTVNGRVCLVTGAASGIGRSLSLELADRGARLVLWDLDANRLEHVVDEIRARGASAWGFPCDVTDRVAVEGVAEQVRAEVGDPLVVVNNAGVVSGQRLVELAPEQIERTFAVNVLALYWVTKAFLPAMLASGEGHVVTVASAAGLVGVARQTDYAASKHAAVGFDESLRMELRHLGSDVRTTVVCPYYIDTGMFAGVKTKWPMLLPILKEDKVARRIAGALARNRRTVILPPLIRLLPVIRVVPAPLFDRLMDILGVNQSMDGFVGRRE